MNNFKSMESLQVLSYDELRTIEGGGSVGEVIAGFVAVVAGSYNLGYVVGKAVYYLTH